MSDCPELKYEDTGWFSYRYYCKVTGAEIGNENKREKVDNLCKKDYDCYKTCPLYKAKH